MKTIFKQPLEIADKQRVFLPKGAVILTVQNQRETPCIWFECESTAKVEERIFEVFGTGHEMREDMGVDRKYIGTFQIDRGTLIFHLYERLS